MSDRSLKRLMKLRDIEAEDGVPVSTSYDLIVRGELPYIELPTRGHRRTLYIERAVWKAKLQEWTRVASAPALRVVRKRGS